MKSKYNAMVGGCALRRVADSNAAGPEGLSRSHHRAARHFPSDTVSTGRGAAHSAVAALGRWGLRNRLAAAGCPPVLACTFDFGPVTSPESPGTEGFTGGAIAHDESSLDKLLVDAAGRSRRRNS